MSKKTKITIVTVSAVLVTLIAAFTLYVSYYAVGKKALPGTKVGEVKVSGLNASQIKKQLETAETKYQVTFSGHGVHGKSFTPKELGYQVNAEETARHATARSSTFNYVSSLFTTRTIPIKYHVDVQVINKLSHELSKGIKNAKRVTEPSVQPDNQGTSFKAILGKDGFGADTKGLLAGANQVMGTQKNQKINLSVGTIKPLTDIEMAKKLADAANKFTRPKITVKAGDKEIIADQKAKVGFVSIPAVSHGAKPKVDEKTIADWVNKSKEEVEVEKVNGQRLVNSSGKVLKTRTASRDGVTVTNAEEVTKEIATNFSSGKDSSPTFETKVDKASNEDKVIADGAENLAYWAAPGEKWIDVNLSSRLMTAYEGATPMRGPILVVTGSPQTPTVTGQYKVYLKHPVQTMRGRNTDGSPYEVPNVKSVLYFTGSYAIHGAYWLNHDDFIAGTKTSHGCVNTPSADAEWIYNWAPIGTPVVSHR